MKRLNTAAACLIGGTMLCGVAMADGPHDKAIKARQAMFQLYSFSAGVLGAMAKGEMDYNAELAQELADNLNAAANLGQSAFWPLKPVMASMRCAAAWERLASPVKAATTNTAPRNANGVWLHC